MAPASAKPMHSWKNEFNASGDIEALSRHVQTPPCIAKCEAPRQHNVNKGLTARSGTARGAWLPDTACGEAREAVNHRLAYSRLIRPPGTPSQFQFSVRMSLLFPTHPTTRPRRR